jgi:hypothetical protein
LEKVWKSLEKAWKSLENPCGNLERLGERLGRVRPIAAQSPWDGRVNPRIKSGDGHDGG